MARPWTTEEYNQLALLCRQGLSRKEIADQMKMSYEKIMHKIWTSPELSKICKRDPNTRGPNNNHGTDTVDKPLPAWKPFPLQPGDEIKTAGSRWRVMEVYQHHFVAIKLTGARYRESFSKRDFMRVGKGQQ